MSPPPSTDPGRGRLLVATDGSRCAGLAVASAIAEAVATGRELDIVSVSIPLGPLVPAIPVTRVERYGGARAVVDSAAREATEAGVGLVRTHTPHGDPAVEIRRLAITQRPQQVFLGRYGESTEATGLFGRVARVLARDDAFAVTIVGGRPSEEPARPEAGSSPRPSCPPRAPT